MIALLLSALVAQAEPTPFWIAPPPPAPAKKTPPKKKPPAKKKKPVDLEPLEMATPPVVRKVKPAEPTWIEPAPARVPAVEPPPVVRAPAPAPIEPEPAPVREPIEVEPAPVRQPIAPAPQVEEPRPIVLLPPPAETARVPKPIVPPPAPVETPPQPVIVEAEPEPEPVAARELRRWRFAADAGAWGVSRSDGAGRAWDFAYGLRFGCALLESFELEALVTRAGGLSGSPFVNATSTRNLAALRAFYVLGNRFALLLGGGAGVALAQTHYTLLPSTDPGAVASGLDANALKVVISITAAGRARIVGGLEARMEVSGLLRDGRTEILPLLGVGAAF